VADVCLPHLHARRILAGDTDGAGINVDALRLPARFRGFREDGARSAAGVEEHTVWLAGKADHGGGGGRPQGTAALDVTAVVLAHAHVGDAQTGNDLARLILDHPHFDVCRIGGAPFRLLALDRAGKMAAQVRTHERPFLEHSRDYPEPGSLPSRPGHPGACGQRSARSLRTPQAAGDPLRPVAVRSQRAPDFDEDVLCQPGCEHLPKSRCFRREQHDVGAPVAPDVFNSYSCHGQFLGEQCRKARNGEGDQPGRPRTGTHRLSPPVPGAYGWQADICPA
jgi:hypothetical protein